MDRLDFTDHSMEEDNKSGNSLELTFSIGYNTKMIGAVHNLTIDKKKEIFFPSANTGVIYNYETGEQKLLQGHCNAITACCTIYDPEDQKCWIVTADSGKNAMIVIWDCETGLPYRFIFKIPTDEIISIDFSKNGYFIAVLSHQKDEHGVVVLQKIFMYEWKSKVEQIYYTEFGVDDGEIYTSLRFNPNMDDGLIEFLVTSPGKIFFSVINPYNYEGSRAYYPHPLDNKRTSVNTKTPTFTQSTFLQKSTMAITATTHGHVVVWDICEALCQTGEVKTDRRKIKTVQLLKYKKDKESEKDIITILLNYEEFIVIGSGDGAIKFYDYSFIIVRWFENVSWMIRSISFDISTNSNKNNGTSSTNNFKCIPFITSDISGKVTKVYNSQDYEIDYNDDYLRYEEIYRGVESDITTIAVHPTERILAIGVSGKGQTGKKTIERKESVIKEKKFEYRSYVQLFYYPDHMSAIKNSIEIKDNDKNKGNISSSNLMDVHKRIFSIDTHPTVIEFSPDGKCLLVGTSDQKIFQLDTENLSYTKGHILQIKEVTDREEKNAEINEIIFSPDESYFAATDRKGRIGLFKYENDCWNIVARHYFKENPIISFCFADDSSAIYAICQDRYLYEFELLSSYENYVLPTKRSIKVEYDCNMTGVVWCGITGTKDKNIIISNDNLKIKTVMVHGLENLTIRQTCLGPCYGNPINLMRTLPEKHLLAFSTKEKIFGLMLLPLDGNPLRYMGVVGHPEIIQDIRPAKNSNLIFTTGGLTVNCWRYNITPLTEAVANGGGGIEPFLSLLEGGREGVKYQDMVNFFYYSQIKSKDENTTKHRTLSETVPLNYLHGLLASLDYYPSNEEIVNIKNEVRYSRFNENEKVENVNFDMFVKLYLNHRPYYELSANQIENAFDDIKAYKNSSKGMSRDAFFALLRDYGEKIDEKELEEILTVLTGDGNVKNLPEYFDFKHLFEEVLLMECEEKEVNK